MAVRVVGVMGCTGTGKSCVSAELASLLEADVVEGDKCFLPPHECPWLDLTHIWPKEQIPEALASKKADTNHPDALDWVKFDEMIASAREVAEVQRRKAVIIDSFLLQCREVVRRHITDVVFLDDSNMHPGELARRKWERGHLGKKSYKERGVSFEDYRLYFEEYVYKRYVEFGKPSDLSDAIVLDCITRALQVSPLSCSPNSAKGCSKLLPSRMDPKKSALIALERLEDRARTQHHTISEGRVQ
eukprot:750205-Hanusia_phi.AAC.3